MKGVSQMISTVLIMLISVAAAVMLGPWVIDLATQSSTQSGTGVTNTLICQQSGYTFDGSYGSYGADWNITGNNGTITSKITNTKMQNLYNFTFEITFQTGSGERIVTYPDVRITTLSQKTVQNPLKAGQSVILEADVYNVNDTWTIQRIKILNDVCPLVSPYIDV
jgi:FlaG/FlaF family flagellin (archaellin)